MLFACAVGLRGQLSIIADNDHMVFQKFKTSKIDFFVHVWAIAFIWKSLLELQLVHFFVKKKKICFGHHHQTCPIGRTEAPNILVFYTSWIVILCAQLVSADHLWLNDYILPSSVSVIKKSYMSQCQE